jgi:hypothetical protein
MSSPLKVVVDCEAWARGKCSHLLDPQGKMCCLGFVAKKLGYSDADILNWSCPASVQALKHDHNVLVKEEEDTAFTDLAVEINDDMHIDDKTRMKRLRALGKEYGVHFTFSNIGEKK